MAKHDRTIARKRLVVGKPEPAGPADPGTPRPTTTPRPTAGRGWYFVTGHYRPVMLTGTEPFIRRWPDGEPIQAEGKDDTLRAAEARRARATRETEEEHDG